MSGLYKNITLKEPVQQNAVKLDEPDYQFDKFSRRKANKNRLVCNHDQNELEALGRRIRKREEEEAKRERELILTGKLKPSQSYIKTDKVIQIQEKMQNIELKSRKPYVTKVKKPPVQMKWQYAVHKLHISPPVTLPMFTGEALDANGTEGGIKDNNAELSDEKKEKVRTLSDTALKIRIENNPVLKSFENAKDVDDLYRIAELWSNSSHDFQ